MSGPVKITDFPSASALGGTEVVAGVQGTSGTYGGTIKILISQIGTYVRGLFTTTPATVPEGGTGVATLAAGGIVTGNGTSAAVVVAAGATTEILVGGGVSIAPVWTTATGSGAPVRATSPTLVTPVLGAASATSLAGAVIATQAQQETGTAVDVVVTPGRQQFHPSACKGWCAASTTGGTNGAYNVTSVTDVGVGECIVVWNVDFSSAAHLPIVGTISDFGGAAATTLVATADNAGLAAGQVAISVARVSDGVATDPNYSTVVDFGDQ